MHNCELEELGNKKNLGEYHLAAKAEVERRCALARPLIREAKVLLLDYFKSEDMAAVEAAYSQVKCGIFHDIPKFRLAEEPDGDAALDHETFGPVAKALGGAWNALMGFID